MRLKQLFRLCLLLATWGTAGCDTIHGPGIEVTAPRVTGRIVDSDAGQPLANVRVARELYQLRDSHGGLRKGVEELRLLQSSTRTGSDGTFKLPPEKVAFLLRFGDVAMNMRLTAQHHRFHPWQTNYPYSALATNATRDEMRLETGDIPLVRR